MQLFVYNWVIFRQWNWNCVFCGSYFTLALKYIAWLKKLLKLAIFSLEKKIERKKLIFAFELSFNMFLVKMFSWQFLRLEISVLRNFPI